MVRRVTIQHLPGCPNLSLACARLDAALRLLGQPVEVSTEEIADPEEAHRRSFAGSPTILVDGIDPFRAPSTVVAFACRAYRTEAGLEGAPSVGQLLDALTSGSGP